MPPQSPTVVNSTCYNEDGSTSQDIPCGFSSINTCCGFDWDCLANGLCREHGTTSYAQGTCTDPNFVSCLSFCDKSEFSGQTEVSRCGPNSWCCAGEEGRIAGGTSCCDTNGTTSLEPYPFSTIDAPQARSTSALVQTSSTSDASLVSPNSVSKSESSASTPFNVASASAKTSSRVTEAAVTVKSKTSQRTPSSTPSTITTSDSDGLRTGAKIGSGIAVPIGVLLLAALAFFIYKFRKQRKFLSDLQRRNKDNAEDRSQDASLGSAQAPDFVSEVAGDGRHEMSDVDGMRHELSGVPRHELSGRPRHEMGPTPARNGLWPK